MTLRRFALLLLPVALLACGRPLTETETAFARSMLGDELAVQRVRLVDGAPVAAVTFRRKARPRVTCRERILPPTKEAIVTAKPAAVTLFNTVFFDKASYADNYMNTYPERISLTAAMLLAHELTHVWQWQNRAKTGYSPLRAAAEHGASDDPYLFELDAQPEFLSYAYEQQGAIVEEYVCCRALDPGAARTRRLHDMLKAAFPVSDLPRDGKRESGVYLPWDEAEIKGICA
jgi:hypothetical protein